MWIETLAGVAIIGVVLALVGMVRGWSSAPLVIVVSGAAGVAIGVIDAVHAPTRGWTVASAFGLAVIGAAWLGVVQYRLRRWDRTLQAAVTDSLPEPAGIASFSAVEPIGIEPEVSDAAVEP